MCLIGFGSVVGRAWTAAHSKMLHDIKEKVPMSRIRFCSTAVAFVATLSCSAAIAQAPASPTTKPAQAASESWKPSMETQVETWTRKEWEAAKKEWAKDSTKWSDCQKQSTEQKLKGRKSWPFLYKCMVG